MHRNVLSMEHRLVIKEKNVCKICSTLKNLQFLTLTFIGGTNANPLSIPKRGARLSLDAILFTPLVVIQPFM